LDSRALLRLSASHRLAGHGFLSSANHRARESGSQSPLRVLSLGVVRSVMPDTSLLDELISEILSPALKVDDDMFSDLSRHSPFSKKISESTSAYLLVCKSFLCVATPLLYHVVILRSKAQANALASALAGNEAFGRFIRKLRVEGGYGDAMLTILNSASNVTDLFLGFNAIFAQD
ncbi:hypothetical protein C8F01DRAFT_1344111, partial [Mycena amicta]